jgi:hypothetical protein
MAVFDIEGVVLPWQSGEDLGFTYTTDIETSNKKKKR